MTAAKTKAKKPCLSIFKAVPRKRAEDCHSKVGEVYQLGPHRVACGDCQDPSLIARLFGADVRRLYMLSDPPYSSGSRQEAKRAGSTSIGRDASNDGKAFQINRDNLPTRAYQLLITMAIMIANRSRGLIVETSIFTDWRQWQPTCDVVESLGLPVCSEIVWDKVTPGLGKGFRKRHELICYAAHEEVKDHGFTKGRPGCVEGDVLKVVRDRVWNKFHPTPKPVPLLVKLMRNTDAEVFYDPFLGSGTLLVAASEMKRQAYGCELDPHFMDVIRWRWGIYARANGLDVGDGLAEHQKPQERKVAEVEDA